MPLERRNEPQMLRQFSKMYPSYNLNPLLRRRHQQLVEAQAFNQWARRSAPPPGRRDLRGRAGPHDGGRQPADPTAALRPGGARERSPDGAGRGRW